VIFFRPSRKFSGYCLNFSVRPLPLQSETFLIVHSNSSATLPLFSAGVTRGVPRYAEIVWGKVEKKREKFEEYENIVEIHDSTLF
jgi:hypothetical protein